MKRLFATAIVGLVLIGSTAVGQDHLIFSADQIEWKPAPAALPPGAQVAILRGDPAQPGLFTMRLKFPANYQIAAHWHPADEHATVLSGTLHIGVGEKFDAAKTDAVSAGILSLPFLS